VLANAHAAPGRGGEVKRGRRNHGSNMNNWGVFGSMREQWRRLPVDEQSGARAGGGYVAKHAEASASLALSRKPRDTARTLPRKIIGSPAFSAASGLPRRPAQPAEIAQARVFERLLQAECAELQELAHRMAGDRYQQAEPDDSGPSGELTQIRARIDEVHGLLRALQGRFPHSAQDGHR
jgi:hypothetical protein